MSRLRAKSSHEDRRHEWNSGDLQCDPIQSKDVSGRPGQTGISQREGDREFGKLGLELCDGLSHLVDRYTKKNDHLITTDGNAKRVMLQDDDDNLSSNVVCDSLNESCRDYIRYASYGGHESKQYPSANRDVPQESKNGVVPIDLSLDEDSLVDTDDLSLSIDSCHSSVGPSIDQPSFCFEYQLENFDLNDNSGKKIQTDFHHNTKDDVENMSSVRGRTRFNQIPKAPDSQYHDYSLRNSGTQLWQHGTRNKNANQKNFLDSSVTEASRGLTKWRCCTGENAFPRGMGICYEGIDRSLVNEASTHWRRANSLTPGSGDGDGIGGGAYPFPSHFGHHDLCGVNMSSVHSSPTWKRIGDQDGERLCDHLRMHGKLMESGEQTMSTNRSTSSEALGTLSGSSDSVSVSSADAHLNKYSVSSSSSINCERYSTIQKQLSDCQKKRLYRIGLNLFNRYVVLDCYAVSLFMQLKFLETPFSLVILLIKVLLLEIMSPLLFFPRPISMRTTLHKYDCPHIDINSALDVM